MEIKFYGYNTFVIKSVNKKVLIDPGADLYLFRFKSLLPENEWSDVTHIFVTHGDPDHHWHTDRVAQTSNAAVICNKTMIKEIKGQKLMLGPRDRGLAFTSAISNFHTVTVEETIELDGMTITGIKATHGPITFRLGPFSKTLVPGPEERVGHGAIGFNINIDGKNIVNLGDTLLLEIDWQKIHKPDVLMVPIGGKIPHNTMDESEALTAVGIMNPKLVIPCHYNCSSFFHKLYNPADDKFFKSGVEKMGIKCEILDKGDSISI